MSSFYLAPSLVTLRSEINADFPHRDHESDGWIGDASHAARKSDHNPDYSAGGVVRAIDVDKDGIDPDHLVAVLIKDDRIEYVIWAGHIYSRQHGFVKRTYTGTNGHFHHVHVSLRHGTAYENSRAPWNIVTKMKAVAKAVKAAAAKVPAKSRPNCVDLQKALHLVADNRWGGDTDKSGDALRSATDFYHNKFPFGVGYTQHVVGATADGMWGGVSVKELHLTVIEVQKALAKMKFFKGKADGVWGPETEKAYQAAKKACHI